VREDIRFKDKREIERERQIENIRFKYKRKILKWWEK
jgi:hypothetical protein